MPFNPRLGNPKTQKHANGSQIQETASSVLTQQRTNTRKAATGQNSTRPTKSSQLSTNQSLVSRMQQLTKSTLPAKKIDDKKPPLSEGYEAVARFYQTTYGITYVPGKQNSALQDREQQDKVSQNKENTNMNNNKSDSNHNESASIGRMEEQSQSHSESNPTAQLQTGEASAPVVFHFRNSHNHQRTSPVGISDMANANGSSDNKSEEIKTNTGSGGSHYSNDTMNGSKLHKERSKKHIGIGMGMGLGAGSNGMKMKDGWTPSIHSYSSNNYNNTTGNANTNNSNGNSNCNSNNLNLNINSNSNSNSNANVSVNGNANAAIEKSSNIHADALLQLHFQRQECAKLQREKDELRSQTMVIQEQLQAMTNQLQQKNEEIQQAKMMSHNLAQNLAAEKAERRKESDSLLDELQIHKLKQQQIETGLRKLGVDTVAMEEASMMVEQTHNQILLLRERLIHARQERLNQIQQESEQVATLHRLISTLDKL